MERFKPVQILLVEDNLDDVEITRRALRKSRVANDVQVARDGEEALEFLFRDATDGDGDGARKPDLILLDLNLPKVNGIEILERVRASGRLDLSTIPVIMLTASDREEDVVKSYQLGSNTYIQKPVEFDKFLHALEVLGQYWIVIATLPRVA